MEAFYPQIRAIHIGAVLTSGAFFLLRGVGVTLFNARWPMAAPVRWFSYVIDTVLLVAALMLTTIVRQFPFVNAWLTVKVLLLAVYVVLGSYALKRAPTQPARLGFFLAAAIVFAFIVSVARAHAPLGVFATGRAF